MTKPPVWFWIAAVLALGWEALACASYWQDATMDIGALRRLPEFRRIVIGERPLWATALFAIAAWAGLAGTIALLLRRGVSEPILLIALLATLATALWPALVTGRGVPISLTDWLSSALMLLIQFLLWTLARHADRASWLRYFR